MDDTELESVTSTMSTSEGGDENSVNCGANRDDSERLHQCLHQIAGSSERSAVAVLVDLVAQTLGADAVGRLIEAIACRSESE